MYEERVLAFIDIMGFGNLSKSQESYQKISQFFDKVECKVSKNLKQNSDTNFAIETTYFSDTIVLSMPAAIEHPGLPEFIKEKFYDGAPPTFMMLAEAAEVQAIALEHGFLTRGCITRGNLYHKHPRFFGPAIIEAYNYETKSAFFPRVILSDSLTFSVGKADPNMLTQNPFIWADSDMNYFTNFLYFYAARNKEQGIKALKAQCISAFEQYIDNPEVLQKWKWLTLYLNKFIMNNQEESFRTIGPVQIKI